VRIAELRDHLIAADPGLTRLFLALRATAAIAVAFGILTLIARANHLPFSIALVGAALGMTWAVAVNDPNPKAQRHTVLLLWFPAAAALALGTLTSSNRILCDLLFLAVTFVSVYIRKYGPRGFAFGMVSVLTFFFALFLRTQAAQLPWLLLALAITTVCTYISRFIVFVDDPERALRNGIEAFHARQRLIAALVAQARRTGHWTKRLRGRLSYEELRLNEASLTLDDILQDTEDSDSRAAVLEAELRTEEAVELAIRDPQIAIEFPALDLRGGRSARTWTPRTAFRAGTQIATPGMSAATRQAFQICAAAAVSMVAGELASPQRWYWAVLTAFVVFSGTSSAGETIGKAWARVLGTGLGVLAGIGVAALVRGHSTAAFIALFASLFFTVYTLRLSYAVMTLFITATLSLLYVLLGFFTDGTLLLRLIETVIGASLGGIAALVVFPIRTRDVVGNVTMEALRRLKQTVREAVAQLSGKPEGNAIAAARAFDESLQTIRAQLASLNSTPLVRDARMQVDLLLFSACGYYGRLLAQVAHASPDGCPIRELQHEAERIEQRIDALISLIENGHASSANVPPVQETNDGAALTYLYRIDRALQRLEVDLASRS
jgi:uncharacterized membrane protein YccC